MDILIIKLGATGDVVRTTPLLREFDGQVTWITEAKNLSLLRVKPDTLRCFGWQDRLEACDRSYDLVINLEDTLDVGLFLSALQYQQLYGAFVDKRNVLCYTDDARPWFDLSLISKYGRERADELKFLNRRTYQAIVFSSLGLAFTGQTYVLPSPTMTALAGDVAIAKEAGPVWPMKNWAYYDELKTRLENEGLQVTFLPRRSTLLEHYGDIANHRCLVGGDSLPMHLALGAGIRCITLFTCTSPWEIHDYGLQTKLISPLLGEFFYERHFDIRATTTFDVEHVCSAVLAQLRTAVAPVA